MASQTEIVGKIEIYKSYSHEWKRLESFSDGTIKSLNSKSHNIKVSQNKKTLEFQTDTTGLFSFNTFPNDTAYISVNENSPVFSSKLKFVPDNLNDTLKIRMSDKKLAMRYDSIRAPQFHNLYSENKARLDFENGLYRILIPAVCWRADESEKNIKSMQMKYGIKYNHLFSPNNNEIRIMVRYNEVMRELIGIKEKNVW